MRYLNWFGALLLFVVAISVLVEAGVQVRGLRLGQFPSSETVQFLAGAYDREVGDAPARWLGKNSYATVLNACAEGATMHLKLTLYANSVLIASNPNGIAVQIQLGSVHRELKFDMETSLVVDVPIHQRQEPLHIQILGAAAGVPGDLRKLFMFLQDVQWSC